MLLCLFVVLVINKKGTELSLSVSMEESNVLVIYHGRCSDGFCSAWVAHKVYPKAQFHAALHSTTPPDVSGKKVFILDFSYNRETLLEMKKKSQSITLLDHHATAQEELGDIDGCIFNMHKSSASMAWDYFAPYIRWNHITPWLVEYCEDRDLNKWKLPHSHEINSAISSYPQEFHAWDTLDKIYRSYDLRSSRCALVQDGMAIARFKERLIDNIVSYAKEASLDNCRILSANTSVEFYDVAGRLSHDRPFGLAWYKREDGKYYYSLRSEMNGLNVGKIAKMHGGGGHDHSAGFVSEEMILKW